MSSAITELEREMRQALGVPQAATAPPAKPKRPSPKVPRERVNVELEVRTPSGRVLIYTYQSKSMSFLQAEIEANQRARQLGLVVLRRVSTVKKELPYVPRTPKE